MSNREVISELRLAPQNIFNERSSKVVFTPLPSNAIFNLHQNSQADIIGRLNGQESKLDIESVSKESLLLDKEQLKTEQTTSVLQPIQNLPQQKKHVIELYTKKAPHRVKLDPILKATPIEINIKEKYDSREVVQMLEVPHVEVIDPAGIDFLMEQVLKKAELKFIVKKNRSFFGNSYDLIFEKTKRRICSAKKNSCGGGYTLEALDQNILVNIGTLSKNFMGSQFSLEFSLDSSNYFSTQITYEMSCSSIWKGPRKTQVITSYCTKDRSQVTSCTHTSKSARYDQNTKKYYLPFPKSVKEGSVKNFILVNSQDQKKTLVFGKSEKDTYILNIRHPFNPFQAFAVAVSSLAYKLGSK